MSHRRDFDLDRVRRYADAIGLPYGWPSGKDRAARPHVVLLPLSRERLGDGRFERMLAAVRACARHIDAGCVVEAVQLRLRYDHPMAGRPTGLRVSAR